MSCGAVFNFGMLVGGGLVILGYVLTQLIERWWK